MTELDRQDDRAADEHLWAIVLAGGKGSRLRALTTDREGTSVPKQFCTFLGEQTLLERALERAGRLVPPERTVVVVSLAHRQWWMPILGGKPELDVAVQPCGRGTAAGILLPLLHVLRQDEQARVVVLPSDHFVADEPALLGALGQAVDFVATAHEPLTLLGLAPTRPETQYGWIMPARAEHGEPARVAGFLEKPDLVQARKLQAVGGLWNSFLFAARAQALLELYFSVLPDVLRPFLALLPVRDPTERWSRVKEIYAQVPRRDFSRDLLQRTTSEHAVVRVPPCGWTDLGTPERVAECLAGLGYGPDAADYWDAAEADEWVPDLAARCLAGMLGEQRTSATMHVA